jgi:hypothetical protein
MPVSLGRKKTRSLRKRVFENLYESHLAATALGELLSDQELNIRFETVNFTRIIAFGCCDAKGFFGTRLG